MTRTFRIAPIHVGKQPNSITVQLEKDSKIPESLFWQLLEDKITLQMKGAEDQVPASMQQFREHFALEGKVKPVIVENVIFSMTYKK